MSKLVYLVGCLFIAGALTAIGCGGTDEQTEGEQTPTDELVELHHMSPVYEEVDDLVSDNHNEAVDEVLDRLEDVENAMVQEGDLDDGDSTTTATQTGDSPSYDEEIMIQPTDANEDAYDSVDAMLDAETPEETQDGTVTGSTTSTRTGEDELNL